MIISSYPQDSGESETVAPRSGGACQEGSSMLDKVVGPNREKAMAENTQPDAGAVRHPDRPGLALKRHFTREGTDPFTEVEWERRDAVISGADGKVFFEQQRRRVPQDVVRRPPPTWWCRSTSAARWARPARALGQADDRPRRRHHLRMGQARTVTSRPSRTRGLPRRARAPAPAPEDGVQLAGLVQRRRRGAPAVLGVLHQLGR